MRKIIMIYQEKLHHYKEAYQSVSIITSKTNQGTIYI
jgi:hypothetical protein